MIELSTVMEIKEAPIQQVLSYQKESDKITRLIPKVKYLIFKKHKSTDLNPAFFFTPDIIQSAQHQYPYFPQEEVDDKLREALDQSGHVLLTGKRNAGKSRMVFEALLQLENPITIFTSFISDSPADPSGDTFSLSSLKKYIEKFKKENFCLYLQDVNRYKSFEGLYHIIESICSLPNLAIIICGAKSDLEVIPYLMEVLSNDPVLGFKHLSIPPLNKERRKSFTEAHKAAIEEDIDIDRNFDKTIGSLLQNVKKVSALYSNLAYDSYEQIMLWSFKSIVFLTGENYCNRQDLISFNKAKIDLKKKAINSRTNTSQDLEAAIDCLIAQGLLFQTKDKQNLYLPSYHLPFIAQGYLFHVFGSNNISPATKQKEEKLYLIQDIQEHYQSAPLEVKHLICNRLLQAGIIENSSFVKQLYEELSEENSINLDGYHALIANSKDLKEAELWDARRAAAGVEANIETLLVFSKFLNTLSALKKKEAVFQLDTVTESVELLHVHIKRASNLQEVTEIFTRFSAETLTALPPYYFLDLVKRMKTFQLGYQVYQLIAESSIPIRPHLYYSLILLKDGSFELAFEILLKLQGENIELTDYKVLEALAKKASQLSEVDKVIAELNRLPEETKDVSIYEILVTRFKNALNDESSLGRLVEKHDNLHSWHQQLLLGDVTEEERKKIIEQIIDENLAEVKSYELYLDHSSIPFSEAIKWYNKMMKGEKVFPSFNLMEILLKKYLEEEGAQNKYSNEILLLYRDIEDMLSIQPGAEFTPVFVLLIKVLKDFDRKVELYELAIGVNVDVSRFLPNLYQTGKTYLDALRVLDIAYGAKITPDIKLCRLLLNIFLPNGLKKKDHDNVILFFKDLKNCKVEDAILSKLYLSLVNAKGSEIRPDDHLQDLRAIGMKDTDEILVEAVFRIVTQEYLSPATSKEIIDDLFQKGETKITEKVIENLVFRSSNYETASSLYTVTKGSDREVTSATYKKLLDYALHARNAEAVLEILEEVHRTDVDYLVPLLSKLENRSQYKTVVNRFINTSEIESDDFQGAENRKYWESKLRKAETETENAQFLIDDLFHQLEEVPFLEDAIEAGVQLLKIKNKLDDEFLVSLIQKILKKANPDQIPSVINFCRENKLDYLQPEFVSEFILHAGDENLSKDIYDKLDRKYTRNSKSEMLFYKSMIHPFYCLLSVVKDFDYPIAMFQRLAKANPNINPIILERMIPLLQKPKDAALYRHLMESHNVQLTTTVLNQLLQVSPQKELWGLLDKYRVDIKGFRPLDPVYNGLLDLEKKERREWSDFKVLFEANQKVDKYVLLTRFTIHFCESLDEEELFALFSEARVKFPLYSQLWTLFEKGKIKFPFSHVVKKIKNLKKLKNGKEEKIPKSDQTQKYKTLLIISRRKKSMEKLVYKLLQATTLDANYLTKVIKRKPTLKKKLEFLDVLSQYSHLNSVSLDEYALAPIIDSCDTLEDLNKVRAQFKDLEDKISVTGDVNARLIQKQFNLPES